MWPPGACFTVRPVPFQPDQTLKGACDVRSWPQYRKAWIGSAAAHLMKASARSRGFIERTIHRPITVSTREADRRDRVSSTRLDPPHQQASPLVRSLIQC
jgi:hypothetical protein